MPLPLLPLLPLPPLPLALALLAAAAGAVLLRFGLGGMAGSSSAPFRFLSAAAFVAVAGALPLLSSESGAASKAEPPAAGEAHASSKRRAATTIGAAPAPAAAGGRSPPKTDFRHPAPCVAEPLASATTWTAAPWALILSSSELPLDFRREKSFGFSKASLALTSLAGDFQCRLRPGRNFWPKNSA